MISVIYGVWKVWMIGLIFLIFVIPASGIAQGKEPVKFKLFKTGDFNSKQSWYDLYHFEIIKLP